MGHKTEAKQASSPGASPRLVPGARAGMGWAGKYRPQQAKLEQGTGRISRWELGRLEKRNKKGGAHVEEETPGQLGRVLSSPKEKGNHQKQWEDPLWWQCMERRGSSLSQGQRAKTWVQERKENTHSSG